jgi:hypothetical protein
MPNSRPHLDVAFEAATTDGVDGTSDCRVAQGPLDQVFENSRARRRAADRQIAGSLEDQCPREGVVAAGATRPVAGAEL